MESVTNSTQWILYHCDSISCDLSNWFAELLFGLLIGLGILGWQIIFRRQRSLIFYQQIFDTVFPNFLSTGYIILQIQDRMDEEQNSNSKPFPDPVLTKSEFDAVQKEMAIFSTQGTKLQEILNASGTAISKDMQEKTQKLIVQISHNQNQNQVGVLTLYNFRALMMELLPVCNTHNMLKKQVKRRREIDELTIALFDDSSEERMSEPGKSIIQDCRDEIKLLDKIAALTNNFKHLELMR